MSNSKKVPTNKNVATSKKVSAKKEISKNSKNVDLENLTDEQLLTMNLDEVNIFDLMKSNKSLKQTVKTATKNEKQPLYIKSAMKDSETEKRFRSRLRKELKRFKASLFNAVENNEMETQKKIVIDFLAFYKKYYFVNNFTAESLSRRNSDKDTFASTKIFIAAVKQLKVKFKIK